MVEPEKPFACAVPDCGMTFTNEDHLHVHTKKHDMMLLGLEQKVYVADQTPTPTRFIRNCEDLGIFQDLQNVNPFDEGFKQAMETAKHGLLSLENAAASDTLRCHQMPEGALPDADVLHTPQFMDPRDSTLFTSNNQRNITISRSSSDESGVIKEYETTTISKLTNEVTTISRIVNKHDVIDKIHITDDVTISKPDEHICQNDVHNETSVSFTNNVIKIHNNIEIRKDNLVNIESTSKVPVNMIYDSVIKDTNSVIAKDVLLTDSNKDTLKIPPIMSQKSIDFVVDSLTSDLCRSEVKKPAVKLKPKRNVKPLPNIVPQTVNEVNIPNEVPNKTVDAKSDDDYEVIIKLPNGKQVRMKAVEELPSPERSKVENNTKEKLKLAINKKVQKKTVFQTLQGLSAVPNILPISTGTLIPVTIVNTSAPIVQKIPIAPLNTMLKPNHEFKKTVKRKCNASPVKNDLGVKTVSADKNSSKDGDEDCIIVDDEMEDQRKKVKEDLNSRVAASRRYRVRLRETMRRQVAEIKQLKEMNKTLADEKAALQLVITEHMRRCPDAFHLRATASRIAQTGLVVNPTSNT